jgi:hypothetical protein
MHHGGCEDPADLPVHVWKKMTAESIVREQIPIKARCGFVSDIGRGTKSNFLPRDWSACANVRLCGAYRRKNETLRRECLDRVIVFGEAHLRQILSAQRLLQRDTIVAFKGAVAGLRRSVHTRPYG